MYGEFPPLNEAVVVRVALCPGSIAVGLGEMAGAVSAALTASANEPVTMLPIESVSLKETV